MVIPDIFLLGAGGHCRACVDVVESTGAFNIVGIVEAEGAETSDVFGYPIIGVDHSLEEFAERYDFALVAVGQIKSSRIRAGLYQKAKSLGANFATVVSPTAYLSKRAVLGAGSIVMHKSVVNCGVEVGENCIINSRALLEHDTSIGDHCHISTSATVNGGVKIGVGTFIGSGAILREGIKIGNGCIIGAGAMVMQDVSDNSVVKG